MADKVDSSSRVATFKDLFYGLFGVTTDGSDGESGDGSGGDERVVTIETEEYTHEFEHTFTNSFMRKVDLLKTSSGGVQFVCYDEKSVSGGMVQYFRFSGVHMFKMNMKLNFNIQVTKIHQSNIEMEKQLGSFPVEVERDGMVSESYTVVTNEDEIPNEVVAGGRIGRSDFSNTDFELDGDYIAQDLLQNRAGTHRFEEKELSEDVKLAHHNSTSLSKWTSDTDVDVDGSMTEVLADTVRTGTETASFHMSDGKVMVPEHTIGAIAGESDLEALAAAEIGEDEE